MQNLFKQAHDFYLKTCISISLTPFHMTAVSASFPVVPICCQSECTWL